MIAENSYTKFWVAVDYYFQSWGFAVYLSFL